MKPTTKSDVLERLAEGETKRENALSFEKLSSDLSTAANMIESELWTVHTRLTGSYSSRKAQYDDIDLMKELADDVRDLRKAVNALDAAKRRRSKS